MCDASAGAAAAALERIAGHAAQAEDATKFDALDAVAALLASVSDAEATAGCWDGGSSSTILPPWQESLRAAIAAVLTARRLGAPQRATVLACGARMFALAGDRWAVAPWSDAEQQRRAHGVTPAQFVAVLVSAAAVEVRVALSDPSKFASSEHTQKAVVASATLLEKAMLFLASDADDTDDSGGNDSWWWRELKPETLLQLRKALVEAVEDLLEFLEECAELKRPRTPLVALALRVVRSWTTLDAEGPFSERAALVESKLVSS